MAVYSDRWKYIFFAAPQTGSKAIARSLINNADGENLPRRAIKDREGRVMVKKHHCTFPILVRHNVLTRGEMGNLFRFTGVRNPFDLLVSRYLKHKKRFADQERYGWVGKAGRLVQESVALAQEAGFEEWLQKTHRPFIEAGKKVRGPVQFVRYADYVIRFEHMQADFEEALKRIGVPHDVRIERFNVTTERTKEEARDYRKYYSGHSKRLVKKLYTPILKKFGYTF